ncbi:MAG: hypothetical protein ATN33_01185 [Epulopiscium sp. Nele67-Bin001]|nr:MAG: hypothetical protein BEN18_07335 [Epulopiscium sp. Nuni2H_MBin001]OON91418.1 MAG: hypothetical protein ATN33_01185 [Epulopiscium sp. Nele67-Bin001]
MVIAEVDKAGFIEFFTDNSNDQVVYQGETFTKELRGNVIQIKADKVPVYQLHTERKVLIVLKALYMTYQRDEYWGIANALDVEEIISDPATLVRL